MTRVLPEEHYSSQFVQRSVADVPMWLPPLQKAALSRFNEVGFPTRRDEEWRFTDVRRIAETPFTQAGATDFTRSDLAKTPFAELLETRLVFVNGRYSAELSSVSSLPPSVKIKNLADALKNDASALEPYLGRGVSFRASPVRRAQHGISGGWRARHYSARNCCRRADSPALHLDRF